MNKFFVSFFSVITLVCVVLSALPFFPAYSKNETDNSFVNETFVDNIENTNRDKKKLSFGLSLREGFSLNDSLNKDITFKNYTLGYGIEFGYKFSQNLNIHFEGNLFKGEDFLSLFLPLSIRLITPLNNNVSFYSGLGGFVSFINNELPYGVLIQSGFDIKIVDNIDLNFGIDLASNLSQNFSYTLGSKCGVQFSL